MIRILTLLITVCTWCACWAQKDLAIGAVFDSMYKGNKHATETTIRGNALDGYNLDLYRSISITGSDNAAAKIEPLLAKDAERATDSEVSHKDGRLYYAFYRLAPDGANRYILYLNDRAKVVLVYIEGDASMQAIKRMFKHK